MIPTRLVLLSKADSNHHKQNQNLLCYHYTIGQLRMQRYDFFCSLTKFSHSFLSSDSILSVSKRTNVTFRLLYDTIRSSLRSAPTGYAFKTKRRKKPSSLNAQQKKRVCQYKTLTHPHCVLSQPTQAARKVTSNQPKYHEYYGIVHINPGN